MVRYRGNLRPEKTRQLQYPQALALRAIDAAILPTEADGL
jgi:hypothetical protein